MPAQPEHDTDVRPAVSGADGTTADSDGEVSADATTAPVAAAAGADVAVMGSAVFNAPDPRALVAQVQAL